MNESAMLDGSWLREADSKPMGVIRERKVMWDIAFENKPSDIHVHADGRVEMTMCGDLYSGRFEEDVYNKRRRLIWSDGEIWVQS